MTSPVDTSVKFWHSGMPNMPVVSGTAGSLLSLLDAFLVSGAGLQSVDSLVIAGGVATCTISAGHSAAKDTVVTIAGATPSGLNGEQKVTFVNSTTVKFATALSDQTATGTITLKMSPLGWNKPYTGTNKAAFRMSDVTSSQFYMRVDDSGSGSARVRGYETMSDIDTGTQPFPTLAQVAGDGVYWPRAATSSSTARPWSVFGDSKSLYLFVAPELSSYPGCHFGVYFGELVPTKTSDPYCCAILGALTDVSATNSVSPEHIAYSNPGVYTQGAYISRSYLGSGGAVPAAKSFQAVNASGTGWSGATIGMPYPNAPDGGLYVARTFITQVGDAMRGYLPGLHPVAMSVPAGSFSNRQVIESVSGLSNHSLMTVGIYGTLGGGTTPVCMDITGPWR